MGRSASRGVRSVAPDIRLSVSDRAIPKIDTVAQSERDLADDPKTGIGYSYLLTRSEFSMSPSWSASDFGHDRRLLYPSDPIAAVVGVGRPAFLRITKQQKYREPLRLP